MRQPRESRASRIRPLEKETQLRTARLARALSKHYHVFGAPTLLVLPCYFIPFIVLLATGWVWELFIFGFIMHLWLRYRYLKDEYWLSNYIRALRMESHLEP